VKPVLTAGQVAVLVLYADGNSYREVGQLLGISETAVKSRIARAGERLETKHVTHTYATALRLGLIEEEPPVPAQDEHPNLINIADGTEYEWVDDPPSGSGPGYANVDDHDWTWPRDALERSGPIEEVRSLDAGELARLRGLR
jgi:DNA-binding CsgD family transcriptional regulator